MVSDPITPARLRELAEAHEQRVNTPGGIDETVAALRAAADQREADAEMMHALRIGISNRDAWADSLSRTLAAREALLARAKNALTVFCKVANVIDYWDATALPGDHGEIHWPTDAVGDYDDEGFAPSVRVDVSDYLHARIVAAEIAEALKGGGDE